MSRKWDFRLDARYNLDFIQNKDIIPKDTFYVWTTTLGARYRFGADPGDDDGDGVPNGQDKCPDTPKGVQVYSNGCPIDLDQDGVPDYLDKCPNTAPGAPVDASGCPYDSDGDGVPDHLDQCPGTPQGVKVDGRGCPLDSDGDGIPDYLDQCPGTRPGSAVNAQGCDISDKDGDGIPDNLDKCPNSPPGMKVGPDGCPLDSDGDGIPDDQDECPNTPPGLKVLPNGCALKGDCRRPRPGEKVDAKGCALDQRFILRGVKFEFDSDRLTKPAEKILDDVADTLAAYPDVAVEVEGHTDSIGTDSYNLGLSERRANSVKRYLSGRGVAGSRMRPIGYGETKPIADNATPEGQEENRRVEFKVMD
jgi:outer membrane protein OmpA-like peptidoglycan-associated protein